MPIETVNYTITPLGGTPRNGSIQVTTLGDGTGTGTIFDIGNAATVDSIQAVINAHSLTSNVVNVTWQATNGTIAVTPVSVYSQSVSSSLTAIPTNLTKASFGSPVAVVSGLMFNTHLSSGLWDSYSQLGGDSSGNQHNPFSNNPVTSTGAWSGTYVGIASGNFVLSMIGNFVVARAGQVTFNAYLNMWCTIAIPGATYVSGPQYFNGLTSSPITGFAPLIGDNNGVWQGSNTQKEVWTVNFPSAGVYPFEILFISGRFGEKQFNLMANGSVILPVAATTSPTPGAPGTGGLVLSPVSQGPYIVGSQASITVQVSGIRYTSRPYLGLLEGHPGQIYLQNGGGALTLPSFNGSSPSAASVLGSFSLSGDNGSYTNKLKFTNPSAGVYCLDYNGAASDANVATTNITISEQDMAWYSSKSGVDLFQITSQGGGKSYNIEVDWMVNAQVNVSPKTAPGDGTTTTFYINLTKPLPPIQSETSCVLTFDAEFHSAVVTATPVTSSGWITGWTATATSVPTSSDVQSNVRVVISGPISYLNGDAFTNNTTFTYVNQSVAISVSKQVIVGKAISSIPSLTWGNSSNGSRTPITATVVISGNGTGATGYAQVGVVGYNGSPLYGVQGTYLSSGGSGYTGTATETVYVGGSSVASQTFTV